MLRDRASVIRIPRGIAADQDNLTAAVRTAVTAGDAATATRLVGALGWYWWMCGHRAEGAELAQAVLALPGLPDGEPLALVYAVAALLSAESSRDMRQASEWFEAAAELAARLRRPVNPIVRLVPPLYRIFQVASAEHQRLERLRINRASPFAKILLPLLLGRRR